MYELGKETRYLRLHNLQRPSRLGLNRPRLQPLQSPSKCLLPFNLYFSIIFGILLLFVFVTCRSLFVLYLLSSRSTGSTFSPTYGLIIFNSEKDAKRLLENYDTCAVSGAGTARSI